MTTPMKRADEIFQRYIRLRDGACNYCGTTERLQAAHIRRRNAKFLRYNQFNCIALCQGHHMWLDTHQDEFELWVNEKFNGRYERLRWWSHRSIGYRPDYNRVIAKYKRRIKALEESPWRGEGSTVTSG